MPMDKIFKRADKYIFFSLVSSMEFSFSQWVFSVMRIMRIVSGERIRRPAGNSFP
jgi:hypothetical protein